MHDYASLESKLSALWDSLEEVFTQRVISEVRRFLGAGEYGLALETICGIIAEETKRVGNHVLEPIRELRDSMQLDSEMVSAVLDAGPRSAVRKTGT